MQAAQWKTFIAQFPELSDRQRLAGMDLLRRTAPQDAAVAAGISHQAVNLRAGSRVRAAVHVQNAHAYHSRLRQWLSAFHGVATHYLPNYLGWRWILDARRIRSPESLLKATLGEFPHLTVT